MIAFLCCGLYQWICDPITSNKSWTMPSCYGHLWSSEKPLLGTLHYKCFWVLWAEPLNVKGKMSSQDQEILRKTGAIEASSNSKLFFKLRTLWSPIDNALPHSVSHFMWISRPRHIAALCTAPCSLQRLWPLQRCLLGLFRPKALTFQMHLIHLFSHSICIIYLLFCSAIYHIVYQMHIRSCTQSTNNSHVWNTLTSTVQTKQHQWILLYPPWKDMPNDHPGLRFSKNLRLIWCTFGFGAKIKKKNNRVFVLFILCEHCSPFCAWHSSVISLETSNCRSQNVTLTKGIQQLHLVEILAIKRITATSPISHTIYVEICRAEYKLTQSKSRPYIIL